MEDDSKGFVELAPNYYARRDTYGWTLRHVEEREAQRSMKGTKKGDVIQVKHDTYHGNIGQVCRTVLDRQAGAGDTPKAIIAAVEKAEKAIEHAILTRF